MVKPTMFRRIFSSFRVRKRPPPRLACDAEVSGDLPSPSPFANAPVSQLTDICDAFWNWLGQTSAPSRKRPDYAEYVHAVNELSRRGREILSWVFSRLDHPEYDAREQAAFLLGELAIRKQLDCDELTSAIEKLSVMAQRSWLDDTKELQANSAAIVALGKVNDERAVPILQKIVLSPEWAEDDISWETACTLGRCVGEPFHEAADPKETARAWIRSRRSEV